MKKNILFILFALFIISFAAAQQTAAEISFNFTRLSGGGSNQYAIWIEDSAGQVVKTLFATRWTAAGGWARRPTSIPMWIERASVKEMSTAQIDAVSGATPATGRMTYTWDGTNSAGRAVPNGNYTLILEATFRMENQIYYRAPIRLGQGVATSQVSVEYIGDNINDRTMIRDVTVRTLR